MVEARNERPCGRAMMRGIVAFPKSLSPEGVCFQMPRWTFLITPCVAVWAIGITASIPGQAQNDERAVVIDFKVCAAERKTVSFSHGTTIYEVKREGTKGCRLRYGTEVENPAWDEYLDFSCLVPRRMSKQEFSVTSRGVDFSALNRYCKCVPRSANR